MIQRRAFRNKALRQLMKEAFLLEVLIGDLDVTVARLVAHDDLVGLHHVARFGVDLPLSGDGNTTVVGGLPTLKHRGAWVFVQATQTQQPQAKGGTWADIGAFAGCDCN